MSHARPQGANCRCSGWQGWATWTPLWAVSGGALANAGILGVATGQPQIPQPMTSSVELFLEDAYNTTAALRFVCDKHPHGGWYSAEPSSIGPQYGPLPLGDYEELAPQSPHVVSYHSPGVEAPADSRTCLLPRRGRGAAGETHLWGHAAALGTRQRRSGPRGTIRSARASPAASPLPRLKSCSRRRPVFSASVACPRIAWCTCGVHPRLSGVLPECCWGELGGVVAFFRVLGE